MSYFTYLFNIIRFSRGKKTRNRDYCKTLIINTFLYIINWQISSLLKSVQENIRPAQGFRLNTALQRVTVSDGRPLDKQQICWFANVYLSAGGVQAPLFEKSKKRSTYFPLPERSHPFIKKGYRSRPTFRRKPG